MTGTGDAGSFAGTAKRACENAFWKDRGLVTIEERYKAVRNKWRTARMRTRMHGGVRGGASDDPAYSIEGRACPEGIEG